MIYTGIHSQAFRRKRDYYTQVLMSTLSHYTSKIPMKHAFDNAGVPTAAWEAITAREQKYCRRYRQGRFAGHDKTFCFRRRSMGVGVRNVEYNRRTG